MLAIGVVSTGIYELILHKKISLHRNYKSHFRAIIISLVSFFFFAHFLPINIIYPYIIATLLGGAVLCFERHDLTKHAFVGGFSFVICYVIFLSFFFLIFPDFFSSIYNIENLSGFIIMGIPIEEYLYGFSFGFMWAPLYEYAHGERVIEKR
ncbi:hypothetical protein HYZ97_01690 [Candidatus Pacearchaeota archaeon]|nr:hypothetical protein [Candidatus Pacearchaeota archaeon]